MAYWKEGDRVRHRLGDRSQAAGAVVQVRKESGKQVSLLGKLLRRKVSTGERVKVRWDDGREGEYSVFDLIREVQGES